MGLVRTVAPFFCVLSFLLVLPAPTRNKITKIFLAYECFVCCLSPLKEHLGQYEVMTMFQPPLLITFIALLYYKNLKLSSVVKNAKFILADRRTSHRLILNLRRFQPK